MSRHRRSSTSPRRQPVSASRRIAATASGHSTSRASRARPRLAVGQEDAPSLDPVPLQPGDLAEAASREQEQPDDRDRLGAIELVSGQYHVEAGDLLRRQEALLGRHLEASGLLAGVGVVDAVSPQLGHAHHHGQHGHDPVGVAGRAAHGSEPVLHLLAGEGIDGQMSEGGQDVIADSRLVGLQGRGLPVAGLAFEELGGEGVHRTARRPGSVVLPCRAEEGHDQPAHFPARLREGDVIRPADGGVADAPSHVAAQEEGAGSARTDTQAEAGDCIVPEFVFLGAGLGVADAVGEGRLGSVVHGRRFPVSGRATGRHYRKRPRRRLAREDARRVETG